MKKRRGTPPSPFRMTPQRAEILRLLEGNTSHPSAEEIYRRVHRKFPGMSFATVYNTLQSLLSRGELLEIRIDRDRSRFDPSPTPHAHLMCVKCGAIADVRQPAGLKPLGKPAGFSVLSCNVEFYGICPACAGKTASKEAKKCQKKRTGK